MYTFIGAISLLHQLLTAAYRYRFDGSKSPTAVIRHPSVRTREGTSLTVTAISQMKREPYWITLIPRNVELMRRYAGGGGKSNRNAKSYRIVKSSEEFNGNWYLRFGRYKSDGSCNWNLPTNQNEKNYTRSRRLRRPVVVILTHTIVHLQKILHWSNITKLRQSGKLMAVAEFLLDLNKGDLSTMMALLTGHGSLRYHLIQFGRSLLHTS